MHFASIYVKVSILVILVDLFGVGSLPVSCAAVIGLFCNPRLSISELHIFPFVLMPNVLLSVGKRAMMYFSQKRCQLDSFNS